ncbi:MAG: hypothetical protein BGO78_10095 [Chloroflexi bacterium 44-23]|nr:MAG: hypothetical protein BGO78_10095 [Chloroflexi bacterium 44-23]
MNKSLKILIIAQHYFPEEVSGAVLATELAEDLTTIGCTVSFVTCAPNYPFGKVYDGYRNRILGKKTFHGITIYRVWSFITTRKDNLARVINWATFSLGALWGGLAAGRQDVVFSYSPPLPLGLTAWVLARLFGARWILRVEDLYPDAAVAAGALRSKFLIGILSHFEKFLYHRADHISLISEGFRQNLLRKGIPADKISVLPVWVNADQIFPMEKENEFRRKNDLIGKFVILYAGNLGQTSALEDVIEAATQLNGDEKIFFVFVGEGTRKEQLMQIAHDRHLKNVIFLPFQPRQKLAEMMAAADIGLVTLNSSSSPYSLPYKTFNIMASGRPILAIVTKGSEINELIIKSECGTCVEPGDTQGLIINIMDLYKNEELRDRMGSAARFYLENLYTKKIVLANYFQMMCEVFINGKI